MISHRTTNTKFDNKTADTMNYSNRTMNARNMMNSSNVNQTNRTMTTNKIPTQMYLVSNSFFDSFRSRHNSTKGKQNNNRFMHHTFDIKNIV